MKPRSQLFQEPTVSANVIISAIIMAPKLASLKVGLAVIIHNFLYEGSLKKEVGGTRAASHFFFSEGGGGHTEEFAYVVGRTGKAVCESMGHNLIRDGSGVIQEMWNTKCH